MAKKFEPFKRIKTSTVINLMRVRVFYAINDINPSCRKRLTLRIYVIY